MLKKKKKFKYHVITIIILIIGITLACISQVPYGYHVFTAVLMGIGTGCISGCILLLVSGMKEREKYLDDEELKVANEVKEIAKELFLLQYDIPRKDEERKKFNLDNEIEKIWRVECWFRKFTGLITSLKCNYVYMRFIDDLTKKKDIKIDINTAFESLNEKITEINEKQIYTEDMAENLYKKANDYFNMITELYKLSEEALENIQSNREAIETSIV